MAIKKAKKSANPITFVSELEGLAHTVKEGKFMKVASFLKEESSGKKKKAIENNLERAVLPIKSDLGKAPKAPPLRPICLELYDPDEDGEEEADQAGGGAGGGDGRRRTGAVGCSTNPPSSPSKMSSDEGSPLPPLS